MHARSITRETHYTSSSCSSSNLQTSADNEMHLAPVSLRILTLIIMICTNWIVHNEIYLVRMHSRRMPKCMRGTTRRLSFILVGSTLFCIQIRLLTRDPTRARGGTRLYFDLNFNIRFYNASSMQREREREMTFIHLSPLSCPRGIWSVWFAPRRSCFPNFHRF